MDSERFAEILDEFEKIAVTGMPISGKTIYTEMVRDRHLLHTDHLSHLPFSSRWQIIEDELSHYMRWVLAGVLVPLTMTKTSVSPDAVIWLMGPRSELSPRQKSFAKGTRTVFYKWRRENPNVPIFI
jgi:hypothetical protein